ncbi:MAG: hypothetical protein JRH20_16780 [Deltaproteobacteria bacterium]|nr:hypothetical protein [Deltaproteobacteria bacterium]
MKKRVPNTIGLSLACAGLLSLSMGCGNDNDVSSSCVEGQSIACVCANGLQGAQVCQANQTYGPCSCFNEETDGGVTSDTTHPMLDGALPLTDASGTDRGLSTDSSTTPKADSQPPKGAPIFLSFGSNVTALTSGDSVTFTTVLTDPNGISDLIGGNLANPDDTITYGAFATTGQEGAYALTISWNDINQTKALNFTTEETRAFKATFFDVGGLSVTRTVDLRFHCGTTSALNGACNGACRDFITIQTALRRQGHLV